MNNNKVNYLNQYKKTVIFTHPYDFNSDEWCEITMNIKEIETKDNTYYYLTYANQYSHGEINVCHPLYTNYKTHVDGDIIVKNKITDALIEGLIMDDSELSKISGKSTPMCYRSSIMRNIANFWD